MNRIGHILVVALLGLYALVMAETIAGPFFPLWVEILIRTLGSLFLFGFSLGHALTSLGTHRALAFLGISFAISLFFELLGVSTGWPFGMYHYTDRLGPRLFGSVPVLIPASWFMMLYPSHVVIERIADVPSRPTATGLRCVIWLAATSALAMTAWDLMADPLLVRTQHWVWEVEGEYYGVPVSNYAGWLVTTFLIFLTYRLVAPRLAQQKRENKGRWWPALPVLAYAVTWLSSSLLMFKISLPGAGLAGFFGMGGYALLALGRLLNQDR